MGYVDTVLGDRRAHWFSPLELGGEARHETYCKIPNALRVRKGL
jgi:hypothetical protein